MNHVPAAAAAENPQDASQLKTLSILHYVFAALYLLPLLMAFLYVFMGVAILKGGIHSQPGDEVGGWVLIGVAVALFLVAVIGGSLTFLAGRRLSQRRGRTLCMVVACISCLSVPLGTALGVFSLIVLSRPSVKALFGER
ncbi:hypothetical protein [Lysobacter sp. 1R34A]|uniref:hypothetical protein n=1 Tax=Lysobacter sp. 1R34A TaxID=3445786 RepID=UPI003EF005B7